MSPEFNNSPNSELAELYEKDALTLREMAHATTDLALLERLLSIVAEKALASEFDIDADEAVLFMFAKIEEIRAQSLAASEARVTEWIDEDFKVSTKFNEVSAYFYQRKGDEKLGTEEDARLKLFNDGQ